MASLPSKKASPISFALFSMTAATLLGDEPPTSDACSSDCSTSSSKVSLTCLFPIHGSRRKRQSESRLQYVPSLYIHNLRLPCSPVWPLGMLAMRDLHAAAHAAVPTAQQCPRTVFDTQSNCQF